MDTSEAWRRVHNSPSGVLGTIDKEHGVHLVPVVYSVVGDSGVLIAVDSKPKRSRRLRRLANIEADPRVTLLVDRYTDDWSRLWWVRLEGRASVRPSVDAAVERAHRERYPQLDGHALGPWIDIAIERVSGWSAS